MNKMLAAREELKRRTKIKAADPEPSDERIAKLDRLQGYCERSPTSALMGIPNFRSVQNQRINPPGDGRFQAYWMAHWFECRNSGMKISLESKPREHWLAPFRLTLYADDRTGLLPKEVFAILEVLPDFQLTLVELAFDFSPERVTRKFVHAHALFGKCRPTPSVGQTSYFGTRRSGKRVQIYEKEI